LILVFVARAVDPDLIADHQRRQQRDRPKPFEIHARAPLSARIALHNQAAIVKPARHRGLDPRRV